MALNADRLGDAITDAVLATSMGQNVSSSEQALMREFWRTVAAEIVNEITTNARTTVENEGII